MPFEIAGPLLALGYAVFAILYARFQNRRLHQDGSSQHPAE